MELGGGGGLSEERFSHSTVAGLKVSGCVIESGFEPPYRVYLVDVTCQCRPGVVGMLALRVTSLVSLSLNVSYSSVSVYMDHIPNTKRDYFTPSEPAKRANLRDVGAENSRPFRPILKTNIKRGRSFRDNGHFKHLANKMKLSGTTICSSNFRALIRCVWKRSHYISSMHHFVSTLITSFYIYLSNPAEPLRRLSRSLSISQSFCTPVSFIFKSGPWL